MFSKIDKNSVRKARHHRQRRNLNGTCERPNQSQRAVEALRLLALPMEAHADGDIVQRERGIGRLRREDKLVGKLVGARALEKGVKKVVFDRGGYLYTGRVAALAEGAREAGLDF